ncbi:MAG TPA: glycoside hydrolase family 32 protein [Pelobium sp.]|nr:glycoside hydrolase family 32 protein [Pelobium sp.]
MHTKNLLILSLYLLIITGCITKKSISTAYKEQYRPQFHFSPPAKWMNDPNGMLFYKGTYHLFYQHYPESNVWGPMHWGHATSTDLVHWKNKPIALFPDSLGYIFSGSAVADMNNTTGFAKKGEVPLIAIFTHHSVELQKEGRNDFENQSLAYSLDDGETWNKYSGNPVLKNPGIKDYRDPKVMWYEAQKKWIMTLATSDHITFYSSTDLKNWTKESEFGRDLGAHGGVWECPDLFPIDFEDEQKWVLLVSVGTGAPNGGSAVQYFIGDFNGKTFTPTDKKTKWIDYGTDNYAGVTWSNTGKRNIFMGWMSNLQYAMVVPTVIWRSAMTTPRELSIKTVGQEFFLTSKPVRELNKVIRKSELSKNVKVLDTLDLTSSFEKSNAQIQLKFNSNQLKDYRIILSNNLNEQLIIGYDQKENQYYIDRRNAGDYSFSKKFGTKQIAPRLSNSDSTDINLLIDLASVEFFSDGGLNVMTSIFFPTKPFSRLQIQSANGIVLQSLTCSSIKRIWN